MKKAYKYRIYPTEDQCQRLEGWFGSARFLYNLSLELNEVLYRGRYGDKNNFQNAGALYKQYAELKKAEGFEWLNDLPSTCANNVFRNLETAYKNFWKGTGKHPTFKRKSHGGSVQAQKCRIADDLIVFPKLGKIPVIVHRPPNGKFDQYTIFTLSKKPSGKYFISFSAELPDKKHTINEDNDIGIDISLNALYITSSGQRVERPDLSKKVRRVKKLQKKLSRQKKGSNNWHKTRKSLAIAHENLTNAKHYILHNHSRKLVEQFDVIGVEGWNIKKLKEDQNKDSRKKRRNINRTFDNNALGEFVRQLKYKGKLYGCDVRQTDEYFASNHICNLCGFENEDIKDKIIMNWECPKCGAHHNRNENSAKNIHSEIEI